MAIYKIDEEKAHILCGTCMHKWETMLEHLKATASGIIVPPCPKCSMVMNVRCVQWEGMAKEPKERQILVQTLHKRLVEAEHWNKPDDAKDDWEPPEVPAWAHNLAVDAKEVIATLYLKRVGVES